MRPQPRVTRRVYWIASFIEERQREKARLLNQHGFDVSFFSDFGSFVAQVTRIRPAIVVLACHGDRDFEVQTLAKLTLMQEIRSAKMVLVCDTADEELNRLAGCFHFRDILPLDISALSPLSGAGDGAGPTLDPWVQRFAYATSSRPKMYKGPSYRVASSLPATIGIPARISWISSTHMSIETRLRPQIGSKIKVTGPIAEWYGLPHLDVVVESGSKQKLRYHFSQGYVVSWTPPPGTAELSKNLLSQFSLVSRLAKPRIYVAIQDGPLRQAVLKTFEGGPYEVAAALQKQALAEEPQFFTPDFVILESTLTTKENLRLIVGLMAALQNPICIVILGAESLGEQLKVLYPQHRFVILDDASPESARANLAQTMARLSATYVSNKSEHTNIYDIPSSHTMSQAEVQVPTVISAMHPTFFQLQLEHAVSQYALVRIMQTLFQQVLKRSVYAKVVATQKLDSHADQGSLCHLVDCYLADTNALETRSLAQVIWQEIASELAGFLPSLDTKSIAPGNIASSLNTKPITPDIKSDITPDPVATAATAAAKVSAVPGELAQETTKQSLDQEPKSKGPTKPSPAKAKNIAKDTFQTLAIIAVGILCLWLFFNWLSDHVAPSGGVYSDQLKKFAPHSQKE